MPEIGALLHDAVPPDDSEPDLDEIAYLAGRRRRHRRIARIVLPLTVLAIVAPGLWVFGGDDGPPHVRGNVVVTGSTTTTTAPTGPSTVAEFAALFAARPVLATADKSAWPVVPADFFRFEPPDQVVVGTLDAVRPGTMTTALCVDEDVAQGCIQNLNLDTVVHVERWLGPGEQDGETVAVPWVISTTGLYGGGPEDEQLARLVAQPYQQLAPIGARVIVFLRADRDDPYSWTPSAVSGIVVEDGDGVALPVGSASAATAHKPIDFDDYVAQVEALLQ